MQKKNLENLIELSFKIISKLIKIPTTIFEEVPKYKLKFINSDLDNIILILRNKIITKFFIIEINTNYKLKDNIEEYEFIYYLEYDKFEIIENIKILINLDLYNININNIELNKEIEHIIFDEWVNLHNN
tara:strand:- start:139 stop:528 length:390 start_codon:yes stop_codon:yes gene_type:complete